MSGPPNWPHCATTHSKLMLNHNSCQALDLLKNTQNSQKETLVLRHKLVLEYFRYKSSMVACACLCLVFISCYNKIRVRSSHQLKYAKRCNKLVDICDIHTQPPSSLCAKKYNLSRNKNRWNSGRLRWFAARNGPHFTTYRMERRA
jgi:hypothetical protein